MLILFALTFSLVPGPLEKSIFQVGTKESVVTEEISTIRKKPSSLHRISRKYTFLVSQELGKFHPSQGHGCKGRSHLKDLV
jgi:hypothetical protein